MTQIDFTSNSEFYIPENGVVTLPEEFRGKTVKVLTEEEEKLLQVLQADDRFRHPKTLEEVLEQVRPIEDISELYPQEPIWESDEEFFEFLEAMEMDVDNYRSIEYLSKESPA